METDAEERRKQNQRDLEFFRSRVRPTSSDLWRLNEKHQSIKALNVDKRADETIWPLVISFIVFLLLAATGMVGRVASIAP